MLEFASLFLGLVWGHQPIDMVVGDPRITRLEIRLDGQPAAALERPPWKTKVDFGLLAPHRLEVIAFGAAGDQLARAEQWVNVPRPLADARLVIEQDEQGRKTHGRLAWESVTGADPKKIEIRFGGELLEVADPRRFPLPKPSSNPIQFLSAELVFPDESTAHAEAAFGDPYGEVVESELTAYLLRRDKRSAKLDPAAACFSDREGRPLRFTATGQGPAEIVVVRDRGAENVLQRLRDARPTETLVSRPGAARQETFDQTEVLRFDMKLGKGDRVRHVWPFPHQVAEGGEIAGRGLFDGSPLLTADQGGFFHFMTQIYPADSAGDQHLADAVALAGLRAAAESRRRVVVLLLGAGTAEEKSALAPAEVRSFLGELQVPLVVWSGETRQALAGAWPAAPSVASLVGFRQAFRKLETELDKQMVVWLAGRHLPADIRFDAQRCPGFTPIADN